MTVDRVTDLGDARLADYADLTDVALRRVLEPEHGLYMAEGAQVIRRALAAGHRPRSVLVEDKRLPQALALLAEAALDPGAPGVPVYAASEALVRSVTGYRVHRGFLAAMQRPAPRSAEAVCRDAARVLVLAGLVDHTNVGAAFRSAAALGFDAVLVSPNCADPLYRRSVKVSMGAVLSMPWAVTEPWPQALDRLREGGFRIVALTPAPSAVDLAAAAADAPSRLALLVGTEGDGLGAAELARADLVVRIPMFAGIDSLNVAAATAVACYAFGPASASPAGTAAGPAGSRNLP